MIIMTILICELSLSIYAHKHEIIPVKAIIVDKVRTVNIKQDDKGDVFESKTESYKEIVYYDLNKNDIIYVENPNRILVDISSNKYNPKIITPSLNENQLIIEFPIKGNNLVSFRSKSIHHFTNIETENILDYKIQLLLQIHYKSKVHLIFYHQYIN